MIRLIYGVGLNDADYPVQPSVSGKQIMCPFYDKWKAMLQRCYSKKRQARHPAYVGCTVRPDWYVFSNFKKWMEQQDWRGKELDKDLLVPGNKVYCADACVFLDRMTNVFMTNSGAKRGEYPIGVYFSKRDEKFLAQCNNPFTGKKEHLGYYLNQHEAHCAWRKRKCELACQLADMQSDPRVAAALRTRYPQPME